MVFIEYFQKVTKTSNLDVTHKSLTQAREEDLVSAYLLSSPGFNLTNVTSSVVTQSGLFCVRSEMPALIRSWLGVTGVTIFGTTG